MRQELADEIFEADSEEMFHHLFHYQQTMTNKE